MVKEFALEISSEEYGESYFLLRIFCHCLVSKFEHILR